MGFSLAFHIIFAVAGIALPLMMVIAETLWLKTGNEVYKTLTKRWARGAAVLFCSWRSVRNRSIFLSWGSCSLVS